MGLMYDDPRLAALTLLRIAAEEAEALSEMTGHMHAVPDDPVQRDGAGYMLCLSICLCGSRSDLSSFSRDRACAA